MDIDLGWPPLHLRWPSHYKTWDLHWKIVLAQGVRNFSYPHGVGQFGFAVDMDRRHLRS